jgi:hypothetical protein
MLGVLMLTPFAFAADTEPPTDVASLIDRMIEAADGAEFRDLGVLELQIHEEETTSEGNTITNDFTAYVDTTNLSNLRLEMANNLVVGSDSGFGWATLNGVPDPRPQTPRMAAGTIRQRLFPLLLPHSLRMEGVEISDEVMVGSFEGEEVYQVTVDFKQMFFASPVMNTTWHLVVRRSDYSLVSAEFLPPLETRKLEKEGVRYRTLKSTPVEGVPLPSEMLLDGIDFSRTPNGHIRIVKLTPRVRGPYEPALFVNPQRLDAIEERF